jgi:hypothetical protein
MSLGTYEIDGMIDGLIIQLRSALRHWLGRKITAIQRAFFFQASVWMSLPSEPKSTEVQPISIVIELARGFPSFT